MTLDAAPIGRAMMVESCHADSVPVTRRLAELGIRAGTTVQVLTRTSGGGAILAIGDDRIAVSREILRGVRVLTEASARG